jgi:hypothetical protein
MKNKPKKQDCTQIKTPYINEDPMSSFLSPETKVFKLVGVSFITSRLAQTSFVINMNIAIKPAQAGDAE